MVQSSWHLWAVQLFVNWLFCVASILPLWEVAVAVAVHASEAVFLSSEPPGSNLAMYVHIYVGCLLIQSGV